MRKNALALLAIIILGFSLYLLTKTNNIKNKLKVDYSFKVNTLNGVLDSNTLKGKVVVLYFGYMNCPDICPTTLSDINNAFSLLSKDELKNVQVVFISVDPNRDKLDKLDDYARYFNKSFIGATSNLDYIKDLTNRYMAYFKYEKQKGSAINYTVAHTTRIYLLNKQGRLSDTLSTHNIDIKQISNAIKKLL